MRRCPSCFSVRLYSDCEQTVTHAEGWSELGQRMQDPLSRARRHAAHQSLVSVQPRSHDGGPLTSAPSTSSTAYNPPHSYKASTIPPRTWHG